MSNSVAWIVGLNKLCCCKQINLSSTWITATKKIYIHHLENDLHIAIRKLGQNKSINSVEIPQILWKLWIPNSHYSNVLEYTYICYYYVNMHKYLLIGRSKKNYLKRNKNKKPREKGTFDIFISYIYIL